MEANGQEWHTMNMQSLFAVQCTDNKLINAEAEKIQIHPMQSFFHAQHCKLSKNIFSGNWLSDTPGIGHC